jgi:hypothetical protein
MAGRFIKKFRLFATPEKAALRLLEHARAFQPAPPGWIDIEQLNHPFLFGDKATPREYAAGVEYALSQGWLELHESDAFVRFTAAGAALAIAGTTLPPDI